MGVYIFFLIGGHVTAFPVLCGISSALLHYFLLVFFGWTAAEASLLYLNLVKVFGVQSATSHFTLKAGIPTWGEVQYTCMCALYSSSNAMSFITFKSVIPLVMVAACAGPAYKYYINPFL